MILRSAGPGSGSLRAAVSAIARLAVRRPRSVLLAAVALSLGCGGLLVRAELSGDMVELFMDGNAASETYRRLCDELGARELMVAAWPVDDPAELFSPDLLAAQAAAVGEMSSWPEVRSVLSFGESPRLERGRSLGVRSETWTEALAAADAPRRLELIEEARRAPHLRDLLGAGRAAVLVLVLDEVRSLSLEAQLELVERTRQRLRSPDLAGERELHLVGFPAAAGASVEVVERGLTRALPVTVLVLVALLLGLYRSVWPAAIAVTVGGLATLGAMGVGVLVDPRVTVPMGAAPVLILVLSLSSVLFVLQRAASCGSVAEAMTRTGPACVLGGVTTALGFAPLALTPAPAIRSLGTVSVLGVLWGLALTLTAVPAILSLLGGPPKLAGATRSERRLLVGCARLAGRRAGVLTALAAAALVLAVALLPRLVVETDPVARFAADHPLRRAIALADESLGGSVATDVVIRSRRSLLRPAPIAALARFENSALEDPRVLASVSVTTPLRRIVELIHPEEAGALGPSEKRARQALFFLPAVERQSLAGLLDESGSTLRVSLRTRSGGLLAHARLAADLRTLARRELADLADLDEPVEVEVTGLMVMLGEWLEHLHRLQLRHLAALVAVVGVLFWLAFRRVGWMAIGWGANALPPLVFVGALAAFGLPFDSDYLMVLMIGLGVAIDDTMHLLHRVREEEERGLGPVRAVRRALIATGPAMVRTTVVVGVGLAPLVLTRYLSVAMFGRELSLVLLVALAVDLLAVPAALVALGNTSRRETRWQHEKAAL